MTISLPIRIAALVGLLAVVALGASTMLLGHSSSNARTSTAQPHSGAPTVRRTPPAATHTRVKSIAAPKRHAKTTTPSKTHAPKIRATHTASPKTHAKPRVHHVPSGNLVYQDLPQPLQWQLAKHKIVVVSLYDPNDDVDSISVAEAHAGAADTNVGFLLVNVLDDRVAGLLTGLLPGGGLLPDPGVLVYRAPGDVMVRLDGFADRDSVAQAVTNAKAGQRSAVTPAAVASAAAAPLAAVPGTTGAP